MTQSDVYMWRDALDKNQFWIGVKANSGFCGWIPTFIDGINECFGNEAYEEAKNLKPGVPVRVKLTMHFAE